MASNIRAVWLFIGVLSVNASQGAENGPVNSQQPAPQWEPARVEHPDLSGQPQSELLSILFVSLPAEADETARAALAARQSAAAAELLKRGTTSPAWTMLRSEADPTARTFLIFDLSRFKVPVSVVIQRLKMSPSSPLERQALILALGEYDDTQVSESIRNALVPMFLNWYRSDPDAGVHSALDWLLRNSHEGSAPRPANWAQADALATIDKELTSGRGKADRGWYVTSEGHTMAVVRGRPVFRMGAPEYERGRTAVETAHSVRIPRDFAIATKEVTVEQFSRFIAADADYGRKWMNATKARFGDPFRFNQFIRTPDSPQVAVSWYDAARYCNWLSEREGLSRDQWVYPDQPENGMELPRNYLARTGYRLLTEAEWEYAARAGTTTGQYFGLADELLPRYAWFDANTKRERAFPVGQLRPNTWGVFDMYGNVWEWAQDRRQDYRAGVVTEDREDGLLRVSDDVARTRRGGSFAYEHFTMRSAHRGDVTYFPMQTRDNVGFRIARTLP